MNNLQQKLEQKVFSADLKDVALIKKLRTQITIEDFVDIKYIKSDLKDILRTQATILNFNLEANQSEEAKERRLKKVINALVWINDNYDLYEKDTREN